MSDYFNNVRCFQNDEINALYLTKFSNLMSTVDSAVFIRLCSFYISNMWTSLTSMNIFS